MNFFKYGYDRNGNRLYRENVINAVFGELYHANGATNGYDSLDQLLEFRRGSLSDTNSDGIPDTVTTATRSHIWNLDAQGNWSSLTTDGTTVGRTHNKQNQVTSIGAATPTFDANGNMTRDETGKQLVYDAWNRLVQVKDSGGNPLVSHKYDALNRRVVESAAGTSRVLYYSSEWQMVEERASGIAVVQNVWSPVYLDAPILRDRDTDNDGSLDERLYVQHDANYNVTALLSTMGAVLERFVQDPYGAFSVLASDWSARSSSSYGWLHVHQSGRYDSVSGLFEFRRRWLSPALGRWQRLDPLGFDAGDNNLYRYVSNSPLK